MSIPVLTHTTRVTSLRANPSAERRVTGGLVAGSSQEERLRYLLGFAELAPAWSPWSHEHRPSVRVEDGEQAHASLALDMIDVTDDPGRRRELVLTAGAGLFYLRLALEAFGERFTLEEFPADGSLIARIALDGRTDPSPIAIRTLSAGLRQSAAREPFSNRIVPAASAKALANECRRERVNFRVIVGDERDAVAALIAKTPGLGREEASLVGASPLICTVTTQDDGVRDWLATGQALAAISARATSLDLGVVSTPELIEDARARAELAAIVKTTQVPQLFLRLGLSS